MKGITRTAAVLCAVVSVSVHADLTGTFKTIAIDGSLADWSNPGDVIYDSSEITVGATPAASTYDDLYLANDAANLYIGLDTAGAGGGDINNGWMRNIFLDTDNNATTGYNGGWFAHGYDYLIQYGAGGGGIYSFAGGAVQSGWSWGGWSAFTFAYNDDVAELAAPLATLGISGGDDVVVEFSVSGGGATETWAASWEGAAETYTVAIPEPATFSMMAMLGGAVLFIRRRLTV